MSLSGFSKPSLRRAVIAQPTPKQSSEEMIVTKNIDKVNVKQTAYENFKFSGEARELIKQLSEIGEFKNEFLSFLKIYPNSVVLNSLHKEINEVVDEKSLIDFLTNYSINDVKNIIDLYCLDEKDIRFYISNYYDKDIIEEKWEKDFPSLLESFTRCKILANDNDPSGLLDEWSYFNHKIDEKDKIIQEMDNLKNKSDEKSPFLIENKSLFSKRLDAKEQTDNDSTYKSKLDVKKLPKSWAAYESSSDEEDIELIEELHRFSKVSVDESEIRLPSDIEIIWPKGFRTIKKCALDLGLKIVYDKEFTFEKAGFTATTYCQGNDESKENFLKDKKPEEKLALSTLVSLVYFLKFEPNEWLSKLNMYSVTAGYALHFLIADQCKDEESRDLLKRSLKHKDGGKDLISERILTLFKTGTECVRVLLNSIERIYRSLARRVVQNGLADIDFGLVLNTCFTSITGLARSFYRQETRKEIKSEEIISKGKTVIVKKEHLVKGLDAPKLHVASEFWTDLEKDKLKNEKDFPNEKIIIDRILNECHGSTDFLLPAKVAKIVVSEAYKVSDKISRILKKRKENVRALARDKAGPAKQVTIKGVIVNKVVIDQTSWITAREETLERIKVDDDFETKFKNFDEKIFSLVIDMLDGAGI